MDVPVNVVRWGSGRIKQIEIYPTVASTNELGKKRIRAGCASGLVLWALRQTKGKGRRGRSWEGGSFALTFSLLWQCPPQTGPGLLPLTAGLGLVETLEAVAPGLKVKWPNDLCFGRRKLGGILIETLRRQRLSWVVLGVGLNVNTPPQTAEYERISLQEITGSRWPRLGILNLALKGVERGLGLAEKKDGLAPLFRRHGNFLDRAVTVFQGDRSWPAIARGVLPDGRLLIECRGGLKALMPDEVSVRF